MRILCVTQRYYPAVGGAENLIKTYLDFLSLNHDVTVFTSNSLSIDSFWNKTKPFNPKPKLNYPVKYFDILTPSEIKNSKYLQLFPLLSNYPGPLMPNLWLELLTKELKFDLIITIAFPYDQVVPSFIAAKKWGIPIIAIPLIHEEFPELFLTGMRLSLLTLANSIFVLSNHEKNLLTNLGIEASGIHKITPYLTRQDLIEDGVSIFKKKYYLKNKKIILFVGSKSFVKGIKFLIESMKKIWRISDDVVLLILGPSTEEYQNYFKRLPEIFKKQIIDLEIVDEKIKNLALESCTLLVLPSKSESFGLVIIESWMHKKPVIGCDLSSTKELIKHMENGIITPFNDVDKLSENISKLLDDDKLYYKLANGGFKKSIQFTDENNLQKFEELCLTTVTQFQSETTKKK
jgi:glycosyltransferase involved in cell wall biosynthesis